ncbi:MAG TPA: Cro/CI family transcriptional regulator, partial [Bryobacteraceae bacterium]|nr:Cro/CI family transcriptional regulator [Bryobacteraceae bacterium]
SKPWVYFHAMDNSSDLIERVAKIVGGQRALAEAMGISPQAVNKWKSSRVPAERVLDFERVTGLSRHQIRPDIYPREAMA